MSRDRIGLAALLDQAGELALLVILGTIATILLLPGLLLLLVPHTVLTVCGRQTRAVLRFWLRHGRAARVERDILANIARAQERLRHSVAAQESRPAPSPLGAPPPLEEPPPA